MPTHGSLSKAGKVRGQTPKIDSKNKRSSVPRVKNRKLFYKRVTLSAGIGQSTGTRRRRRR